MLLKIKKIFIFKIIKLILRCFKFTIDYSTFIVYLDYYSTFLVYFNDDYN